MTDPAPDGSPAAAPVSASVSAPVSATAETDAAGIWTGDPERLDRVLPELGLVRSRSQASEHIGSGHVWVNGTPASKAGLRVTNGSRIEVRGIDRYVSRAAHKLVAGLDTFGIDPKGVLALDLGASTGGFTQVLLERGARGVLAIDVGHAQLVPELAADPRVFMVEGCNARDLTAAGLATDTGVSEAPELVVADLSFISLTLVLPAIARVAAPGAECVLLVKPQFEVGRLGIKEGIVTDPGLRAGAIRTVVDAALALGFVVCDIADSPIAGGAGNREFLLHLVTHDPDHPPVAGFDPTEWEQRILALDGLTIA